MELKHWICSCGKENDAYFCIQCGHPKPNEPEELQNLGCSENDNAYHETFEYNTNDLVGQDVSCQRDIAINDANNNDVLIQSELNGKNIVNDKLRKLGGSRLFLSIAISISLLLATFLVSLIIGFTQKEFNLTDLISIVIYAIFCAGVWIIFTESKKTEKVFSSKGEKIIRGVVVVLNVFLHIGFALLFALVVFADLILSPNFNTLGDYSS